MKQIVFVVLLGLGATLSSAAPMLDAESNVDVGNIDPGFSMPVMNLQAIYEAFKQELLANTQPNPQLLSFLQVLEVMIFGQQLPQKPIAPVQPEQPEQPEVETVPEISPRNFLQLWINTVIQLHNQQYPDHQVSDLQGLIAALAQIHGKPPKPQEPQQPEQPQQPEEEIPAVNSRFNQALIQEITMGIVEWHNVLHPGHQVSSIQELVDAFIQLQAQQQ